MDILGRSQRPPLPVSENPRMRDLWRTDESFNDAADRSLFRATFMVLLSEKFTEEEWQATLIKAKRATEHILKLPPVGPKL
jgi:hypothetical protein